MPSPFTDAHGRPQRCLECKDRMPKTSAAECEQRLAAMPAESRSRYYVHSCMSCGRSEIISKPPVLPDPWREVVDKHNAEAALLRGPRRLGASHRSR